MAADARAYAWATCNSEDVQPESAEVIEPSMVANEQPSQSVPRHTGSNCHPLALVLTRIFVARSSRLARATTFTTAASSVLARRCDRLDPEEGRDASQSLGIYTRSVRRRDESAQQPIASRPTEAPPTGSRRRFGVLLRRAREEAGIGQRELSRMLPA